MASLQKGEDNQQLADNQQQASPSAVGWIEYQYRRLKENAETYPYVWASYAVVYIGFGLWTTYRWRKLRQTEDRVRVLQARLHKLVEAEESATSTVVTDKAVTSTIAKAEESVTSATVTDKALPSNDRPIK